MATPRRSSRLRGCTPQANDSGSITPLSMVKLSVIQEAKDNADRSVRKSLSKTVDDASPKIPGSFPDAVMTTPTSAFKLKPDREEMHPKHFQNPAFKAASEKRLSQGKATREPETPCKSNDADKLTHSSPCRPPGSAPAKATFDFRCIRPSTELSSDTQKMMEQVRLQAVKIREQLFQQREGQLRKEEATQNLGTATLRKIAKPVRRIGRYSDAHLQEFKKMTSIENHPSAFRADPLRLTQSASKTLKRKTSKAELDSNLPVKAQSAKVQKISASDSPVKRFKAQKREASEKVAPENSKPSPRSYSALSTPTKASMARSSSVKSLKVNPSSKIPSLSRSPSIKAFATPTTTRIFYPQTEGAVRTGNAFSQKLASSIRSILRRPQVRYSNDPVKVAAGTHVSTPNHIRMKSPSNIPTIEPGSAAHRKEKHVNFSPSPPTIMGELKNKSPGTPSPAKRVASYPVVYPTLPDVNSGEPASPTPVATTTGRFIKEPLAGAPGDFTFRSDKVISFGQARQNSPSIHKVRSSDGPLPIGMHIHHINDFPTVPHGLGNKKRKRVSPDPDGTDHVNTSTHNSEDKENILAGSSSEASPNKKVKTSFAAKPTSRTSSPLKSQPFSTPVQTPTKSPAVRASTGKGRAKAVLSISRLNALARPKNRA